MSEHNPENEHIPVSTFAIWSIYTSLPGIIFLFLSFGLNLAVFPIIAFLLLSISIILALTAIVERFTVKKRYWWLGLLVIGIPLFFCALICLLLMNFPVVYG